MRTLIRSTAAVASVGAILAVFAPVSQAATPPLKFATFVADQPGTDTPVSTTKLNRESIAVLNTTTRAINLTGYSITDNGRKHVYRFPKNFVLGAKKTVVVHTGTGKASAANLYWGMTKSYIWNNSGDTARLLNSKNAQLTTCTYVKVKSGIKYC